MYLICALPIPFFFFFFLCLHFYLVGMIHTSLPGLLLLMASWMYPGPYYRAEMTRQDADG